MSERSGGVKDGRVGILLVDDDLFEVKIIRERLESVGYEVRVAREKKMAMGLLFSEEPGLVILKTSVPGLDGYEVCRRLRECSNVPIILLAARATTADELKGFKMGADDFVAKPFSVDELVARVGALLRRVEFLERSDARSFFLAPELSGELVH